MKEQYRIGQHLIQRMRNNSRDSCDHVIFLCLLANWNVHLGGCAEFIFSEMAFTLFNYFGLWTVMSELDDRATKTICIPVSCVIKRK